MNNPEPCHAPDRANGALPVMAMLGHNNMFDLVSKYHFVFEDMQVNILLMLIEEYVNGAELQITRIERTRRSVRKTLSSIRSCENANWQSYRKHHLKMFCDAYFYFICIGQVSRCLVAVARGRTKGSDCIQEQTVLR